MRAGTSSQAPPADAARTPAPRRPSLPDPRACYGVLRFVMESGAKGCEVIVSGKLRAARAKSMKFKDGYMVSSGDPTRVYLDTSVRHVLLRQGVLGIKVRRRARCRARRAGLAAAAVGDSQGFRACQPDSSYAPHARLARIPPASLTALPARPDRPHPSRPRPQVRIMKDWDPTGRQGPKMPLPDVVKVHEPKEEEVFADKAKELDL